MSYREMFIREDLENLERYDKLCREIVKNTVDTEIRKVYNQEVNWNLKKRVELAKHLMKGHA